MALSYKSRRRWALVVLVVGLPIYIILAVNIVAGLAWALGARLPILLELLVYVGLGVLWIYPFKSLFMGIGQADPDAPPEDDPYV